MDGTCTPDGSSLLFHHDWKIACKEESNPYRSGLLMVRTGHYGFLFWTAWCVTVRRVQHGPPVEGVVEAIHNTPWWPCRHRARRDVRKPPQSVLLRVPSKSPWPLSLFRCRDILLHAPWDLNEVLSLSTSSSEARLVILHVRTVHERPVAMIKFLDIVVYR